jgi:hypothetical protein
MFGTRAEQFCHLEERTSELRNAWDPCHTVQGALSEVLDVLAKGGGVRIPPVPDASLLEDEPGSRQVDERAESEN